MTSQDEILGLALGAWTDEKEPIQYIEYPHAQIKSDVCLYDVVPKRTLSPFYGKGDDRDQWCATTFGQYAKQLKRKHRGLKEVDLKIEELFLRCALQKSLAEGEHEKKFHAKIDEPRQEETSVTDEGKKRAGNDAVENDDDDEVGVSRMTRGRTSMKETTERLRVGDQIAFYKQQGVAGDERNLCEATILYINPAEKHPVTIDDTFTWLGQDHQVKRTKKYSRGKLNDHNGQFRPINQYILMKEGDPDAHRKFLEADTARNVEIMQRNKEETIAKMKKDGFYLKDILR